MDESKKSDDLVESGSEVDAREMLLGCVKEKKRRMVIIREICRYVDIEIKRYRDIEI